MPTVMWLLRLADTHAAMGYHAARLKTIAMREQSPTLIPHIDIELPAHAARLLPSQRICAVAVLAAFKPRAVPAVPLKAQLQSPHLNFFYHKHPHHTHCSPTMADASDSDLSSALSEHSDKEIQKLAPIFIKAKRANKVVAPPPVVSPPRPKRPPSPPHEEVLADNPAIAVSRKREMSRS